MTRTAVDTSVVISALLNWHDDHERALTALAGSIGPGRRLVLSQPVLVQSFSVMTRLPPRFRLQPREAFDFLQSAFGKGADLHAMPARYGWELLEDAVSSGVVGGGVYDFQILRCAADAGALRLLTFNPDDFLRFGNRGVEIVEP